MRKSAGGTGVGVDGARCQPRRRRRRTMWLFRDRGGLWFPSDTDIEVDSDDDFFDYDLDIEHKMGFDGDIIGGYDFGPLRRRGRASTTSRPVSMQAEADFGDGGIEATPTATQRLVDHGQRALEPDVQRPLGRLSGRRHRLGLDQVRAGL